MNLIFNVIAVLIGFPIGLLIGKLIADWEIARRRRKAFREYRQWLREWVRK